MQRLTQGSAVMKGRRGRPWSGDIAENSPDIATRHPRTIPTRTRTGPPRLGLMDLHPSKTGLYNGRINSMKAVEPFTDTYRKCPVCKLKLHVYLFPYKDGRRRTVRDFSACLGCIDAGR